MLLNKTCTDIYIHPILFLGWNCPSNWRNSTRNIQVDTIQHRNGVWNSRASRKMWWSAAMGPILKAKNLRKRRITYTSWCFTQILGQRYGEPPFALPASYALLVGDFEMVRNTMDNAKHCEGGTMQQWLWKMEEKKQRMESTQVD